MKKELNKFIKSFYFAGSGVIGGFSQRNMRIQGIAAVVTIGAGVVCGLSRWEWLIVIVLIGLVWLTELINSSIEELADLIRDHNKLDYQATKSARDLAAGAVLIAAITALMVGIVIFTPKIIN